MPLAPPANDGTWQNGRQLARMQSVDTNASFVYNENSLRVQKTVNGVVTNYTLHGKNVVHMTQGNDELHFFYDAQNKPAIVVFNGASFSYVKNLQGDIVAILDSNGNKVVEYKYDAWGKPFTPTGNMKDDLGRLNPFRYRGYVYDNETEVYYLRSRYYYPYWCRFKNTDVMLSMHLLSNTYSYCENRIIVRVDNSGTERCFAQTSRQAYISKGNEMELIHGEIWKSCDRGVSLQGQDHWKIPGS